MDIKLCACKCLQFRYKPLTCTLYHYNKDLLATMPPVSVDSFECIVDLRPTGRREQDGARPALVLSVDKLNHGPADLVIVVPITKTGRSIPTHVLVPQGEAGLTTNSYVKCEDLRSIS